MIKVSNFEVVRFEDNVFDDKGNQSRRQIILLYALGEDGCIYELNGGRWLALPIEQGNLRSFPMPVQQRGANNA